jgi:hypothetical protein
MPVNEQGCGLSAETIAKADMVYELGFILTIVDNIWKKGGRHGMFPFQYIDLHCGPGAYYEGMLPNVASVFYELFRKFSFPIQMHLIDKNPDMIESIKQWIPKPNIERYESVSPRIEVSYYCEQNVAAAPRIIRSLRNPKLGLFACDGNGPSKLDALIKSIASLDNSRYIDWFFHLSANSIGRPRRVKSIKFDWYLTDYFKMARKRRFLLKASPNTRDKWLVAYGTNNPTLHEWKRNGWIDRDTDVGKELLYRYNFTKDELNGRLFEEDESQAS